MNVKNRGCIRRISKKSMLAAHSRNRIAILAIALTTMLFTSLFTIVLSMNKSFQDSNFRQVGGFAHGTFKNLTEEQYEDLKTDDLIKEYGYRRFVGMPTKEPFLKSHVEVSYCDAKEAHWFFLDPKEGRLPKEGTNEAATDTRVLSLLGITPELGTEFTITFQVDGKDTTQTFVLCGWWEYDEVCVASHVLIPESYAEQIFQELNTQGEDGMTSYWTMDVMFQNSLHIEENLQTILERHGYQNESRAEGDNYIAIGVNWGYTGSQLSANLDPITVIGIVVLLLVILFTGYLIIYNVFQISVTNDIHFYGLLKTIGTTGKQIRKILYWQALFLSVVGIPIGLLLGYLIGITLTPVILSRLVVGNIHIVSANPIIFLGSILFSLLTVWISCLMPGKIASKVSPIEAVRYTESSVKRKTLRAGGKVSLAGMAWANIGRNKRKTIVTVLSLSLAVVLFHLTISFTNGFDMDKYLADMVADFIVADSSYFQVGLSGKFNEKREMTDEVIDAIQKQEGICDGGRIYGTVSSIYEYVSEEYFRSRWGEWNDKETVDQLVKQADPDGDKRLEDFAELYGMDRFALDQLRIIEGDLSKLYEPGAYIAAVYIGDDYDNVEMDSHWAKVGDVIPIRYVDQWEYRNTKTGKVYYEIEDIPETEYDAITTQPLKYREIEYEVVALVIVPHTISYRYYGTDQFVLNADTFCQDSKTNSVMLYCFDTTEEANEKMEEFLSHFTEVENTQYDFESKQTYADEFHSFQMMFLILGGVLCFIIGLVGILNFLNAVLTSMITRKREFAVLQAIGMTGKQLKGMLIWEGMYHSLGAVFLSLIFCLGITPLVRIAFESMFWFFTFRFTILPVICVAPVFAFMGVVLPLVTYQRIACCSIVERLREIE